MIWSILDKPPLLFIARKAKAPSPPSWIKQPETVAAFRCSGRLFVRCSYPEVKRWIDNNAVYKAAIPAYDVWYEVKGNA